MDRAGLELLKAVQNMPLEPEIEVESIDRRSLYDYSDDQLARMMRDVMDGLFGSLPLGYTRTSLRVEERISDLTIPFQVPELPDAVS